MAGKKKKKSKRGSRGYSWMLWALPLLIMAASMAIRIMGMGKEELPETGNYQLEVLNGTGEKNLVKNTTRQLRRIGMDVLLEGNAEEFDFGRSVIIDRRGNPELAERVARRLGCEVVIQQIQENPKVDLTFIVGDDKEELDIAKQDRD
ncbi:MAG: hypothetical protein GF417_02625 [Candidatus Latescibacteria bacterium]|nr:hypothetical protein [bacterium]MBD3423324.1 hypothetical protein [Candidatus Latescibacterota bacterium]